MNPETTSACHPSMGRLQPFARLYERTTRLPCGALPLPSPYGRARAPALPPALFGQMTLLASTNATSSPALAAGLSACGSPEYPTQLECGQEAPPASPTPSLQSLMVERKAKAMTVILRQFSFPSSESAALQRSLESRLEARLSGDGGTNSPWRLKGKATPARRRFCELTPSVPRTKGSGSIGWPTPAARDGKDISRSNAFLSQRLRHSPSMATRLLTQGAPWTVITAIYCLAMGFQSSWNVTPSTATAMRSSRKSRKSSSNA
jgi:hypothetical protein